MAVSLPNQYIDINEQLFINERAQHMLVTYKSRMETIFKKTKYLLDKTDDLNKQRLFVENAIRYVNSELQDVYTNDVTFESTFGQHLVNEIRFFAQQLKDRLVSMEKSIQSP